METQLNILLVLIVVLVIVLVAFTAFNTYLIYKKRAHDKDKSGGGVRGKPQGETDAANAAPNPPQTPPGKATEKPRGGGAKNAPSQPSPSKGKSGTNKTPTNNTKGSGKNTGGKKKIVPPNDDVGIDDNNLPYVKNRVYEEGWGHRYNVFVTENGSCYHKRKCPALNDKKYRVMHVYTAVQDSKLSPCSICNPKAYIDDWYAEQMGIPTVPKNAVKKGKKASSKAPSAKSTKVEKTTGARGNTSSSIQMSFFDLMQEGDDTIPPPIVDSGELPPPNNLNVIEECVKAAYKHYSKHNAPEEGSDPFGRFLKTVRNPFSDECVYEFSVTCVYPDDVVNSIVFKFDACHAEIRAEASISSSDSDNDYSKLLFYSEKGEYNPASVPTYIINTVIRLIADGADIVLEISS